MTLCERRRLNDLYRETTSYETLDAGTSDMIKPHKLRDLVPPIRYLYKCNSELTIGELLIPLLTTTLFLRSTPPVF